MRTGIATVPLDTGRCPKWLFERMNCHSSLGYWEMPKMAF